MTTRALENDADDGLCTFEGFQKPEGCVMNGRAYLSDDVRDPRMVQ